ncbi:protein AMBP-like [Eucyclogobius newberryi]|uniref:protein AMBP-like n=1 Tax=Eucyclogobius newberryi TaxID=166745 RepID=UPI003B5B6B71
MAVVSTCPHFMQRKMRSSAVVEVNLQHSNTEGNITVTTATFRNDSCKTTFTGFTLTDTPGRFFYHVPQFSADVEVDVVDTDYVERALLVLLSTEKPAGNQTLIAKLYTRSKDVSAAVMENFKTLVRKQGMNEKTIVVNRDRGQC